MFSTSWYPNIVPMMNRWLVKRFVLHLYIFHLYLIINKNTEKDMYLVIQERFSSNIWYVTIFCEYPVSLKLLLNILYPNNFFLKYPVSRKPLVGPHSLRGHSVHFSRVERSLWSMSQCRPNPSFLSVFRIILTRACLEQNDPYSWHDCPRFLSFLTNSK